jgi:hypothetical protein
VLVAVVAVVAAFVTMAWGDREQMEPVGQAPSGPIDLAGWKLSIPEPNAKGEAASIDPAVTKAPWLTPAPQGALMFWAPATGVTTRNSEHPRTELQSLTEFPAGAARHTLSAALTVLQLPSDGRGIIIGQIHGAGELRSVPYVMLRVQGDQLRVVVKQAQNRSGLIEYPLLDGVGVNSRIDYTIADNADGTMLFSAASNGSTRQAKAPVPAAFYGAPVRFQAGDYQQANASGGVEDGGRVIFHGLAQQ